MASKFVGMDVDELNNLDEWLSYDAEAEYANSNRRNKLTREIIKIF